MGLKKYFDAFWESIKGKQVSAKKSDAIRYFHVSKRFRRLTADERAVKDAKGVPTGVILPEFWAKPGVTYDVGRNKRKALEASRSKLLRAVMVKKNAASGRKTPKYHPFFSPVIQ